MFVLFLRSLQHRWLESLLMTAAVALPVAALTVQRSLSASTEEQIHAQAHDLGNNMLVLSDRTELADHYALHYDDSGMPDLYPERIASAPIGRHIGWVESRLGGNLGLGKEPFVFLGIEVAAGGRPQPSLPKGMVALGPTASTRLNRGAGDRLQLNEVDLVVGQVLGATPEGLDTGVFASLYTAQQVLRRHGEINSMQLAGCWCSLDVPALAEQVEALLPGTQALTISGMLEAQKGTIAQAKRYSRTSLIAAIVLIAGLIMALIASQVRRQVREIGLLLATGAEPLRIVLQFVLKAAIVGVLGGALGHVLGRPITERVASAMVGVPLPAPASLLVPTVLLSGLLCAVAAFLPALRAARLDPTEVLRDV